MDKIDFLPERIKARRARNRRLVTQGWLLGICAAALALLAYVRQGEVSKARAELSLLDERTSNIRLQLDKRALLEEQLADLLIKERISQQLGSRVNTLAVLAELSRLLPKSMALSSLEIEPVKVRLAVKGGGATHESPRATASKGTGEKEITRVRLVLTGLAPTDVDVANFIGQLAACPLFEDVNMGYAKTVVFRQRSARQFQASCYVAR